MKFFFSLACVFLIMATTGCATYVQHRIPPSTYTPKVIDSADKADMTYSVLVRNVSHLSGWKTNEIQFGKSIRDFCMESGYFSTVRESRKYSDFHIDFPRKYSDFHIDFQIIMNPSPHESFYKYLAAFTLGLIPLRYTNDVEFNAIVYECGVQSASFSAREEVVRALWLPLVFVGISKDHRAAETETKNNYLNNLFWHMEGKNLLPAEKCSAQQKAGR
jgi:hypothetical protein